MKGRESECSSNNQVQCMLNSQKVSKPFIQPPVMCGHDNKALHVQMHISMSGKLTCVPSMCLSDSAEKGSQVQKILLYAVSMAQHATLLHHDSWCMITDIDTLFASCSSMSMVWTTPLPRGLYGTQPPLWDYSLPMRFRLLMTTALAMHCTGWTRACRSVSAKPKLEKSLL